MGDSSPRPRRTPNLLIYVISVIGLIDWTKEDIYEPIFTCDKSKEELEEMIDSLIDAPYFPLHTQSTEQAVKLVTEASASVCGFEGRDGFVKARVKHRKMLPTFSTKKDILALLEY